ncbi:MAG: ATP-binding protein [Chloroflexota bacterium]
MSQSPLLNWAILAVSLFNTVALIWLGLTVFLNSDRRAWGIWLGSGGLLLGGLFFVTHTAILVLGLFRLGLSMLIWWTVGLSLAIVLPFAWYVVMLWYAGFWEELKALTGRATLDYTPTLYRRQRFWFLLTILFLAGGVVSLVLGVFLLATPSTLLAQLRLFARWSVAGVPLVAVGYSVYVLLCTSLSLDALRRPGLSTRTMGALARQRARSWLVAASLALLVVSLVVTGTLLWLVATTRQSTFHDAYANSTEPLAALDFIVTAVIALVVICLGQAVVSYEIFTGKTLPRRGLERQWRWVIILAAGYSLVVGGSLVLNWRPIYLLLLTTLAMTVSYALVSWRSYAERERYIAHLRPFVASQRLLDQLLRPAALPELDVARPFQALCANILDARVAYLAALGPLAPLAGPPLVYPAGSALAAPSLTELASQFGRPSTDPLPLDPARFGGAVWAIPLWSERGLIGVFLLGEKGDGRLYPQEEIEIARISGERLIDTQASAEMARRLMALQRERLAQSQVIDQQTRRTLHDDILPSLQTALIALSSTTNGTTAEATRLLSDAHRQISDLLRNMPRAAAPEVTRLGLIGALRQLLDGDLGRAFDEVAWEVEPEAMERVKDVPALAAEVIFYAAREAIRNAARYGRDAGSERPFGLRLSVNWRSGLELQIEDNGVGLGAAVPSGQGAGQGLALHSTMMAVIGGALAIHSAAGQYTRVILTLPL